MGNSVCTRLAVGVEKNGCLVFIQQYAVVGGKVGMIAANHNLFQLITEDKRVVANSRQCGWQGDRLQSFAAEEGSLANSMD